MIEALWNWCHLRMTCEIEWTQQRIVHKAPLADAYSKSQKKASVSLGVWNLPFIFLLSLTGSKWSEQWQNEKERDTGREPPRMNHTMMINGLRNWVWEAFPFTWQRAPTRRMFCKPPTASYTHKKQPGKHICYHTGKRIRPGDKKMWVTQVCNLQAEALAIERVVTEVQSCL